MRSAYADESTTLYRGDCRTVLPALPTDSVQCVVTSPPYWGLRDYGVPEQLGLEATPAEYVERMVEVFREVRRVLRADGTLWLNLGDCYATQPNGNIGHTTLHPGCQERQRRGSPKTYAHPHDDDDRTFRDKPFSTIVEGLKPKDLVGMPWRVALALQADGWYLRSDIIWSKPNPMPESVTDRPTKSHEYLFLLTRSARYFYDADAVREPMLWADRRWLHSPRPGVDVNGGNQGNGGTWEHGHLAGRNRRTVWTIATQPYPEAHFATFPEALVEPCILAGCPVQGLVLDPFAGSGTTLAVAKRLDRRAIGIELSAEYVALVARRCRAAAAQISIPGVVA